jgi:UDP-glucose 4-epimerase
MKTVLVTGGAGFIGSALCKRLLSEGLKVVAFDNFSGNSHGYIDKLLANKNFEMIKLDVNNLEVEELFFKKYKFDVIYHLAANTSIPKGQDDIEIDIRNTFFTTINILQLAVKYNVKKFVFTSSSTIYGLADYSFDETSVMHPISYYGASKLSCEAFISAFSHRYDIQTWILRFCNVVGAEAKRGVVCDIKKQLVEGKNVVHLLGDGKQEKPFLYIDDAIDGLLYVVNNAKDRQNTYLIGNGDTITVRRIAEIALEETNHNAFVFFDNAPTWPGDVQKYCYDVSKASQLGWQSKYNSEEAIRKSFK